MKRKSTIATIVLALPIALSAVLAQQDAPRRVEPSKVESSTTIPVQLRYLGARSCASSTCHGSVRPDLENPARVRRDEYLVWLEDDPHQGAHAALSEPRSVAIFENLGLWRDGEVIAEEAARFAQVQQKCQACHTTAVQPTGPDAVAVRQDVLEGVTCEVCHGPAEKWLARHYRTDFGAFTTEEKAAMGFRDTNSTRARAQLCVGCHVGSPEREVNHDWIAAGHPALKFELTAYLDQMPPHWKTSRDQANAANAQEHELELWLAGQEVAADAALSQLARRTTVNGGVWPEFAEADCYSCHHDLGPPVSWRQERGFGSIPRQEVSRQVTLPMNEWYLFMLRELAKGGDAEDAVFLENLDALRVTLESSLVPSAVEVSRLARETQLALKKWSPGDRLDRDRILDVVGKAPAYQLVTNWDRAVQSYLMLRAAEGGKAGKEARDARQLLAFPRLENGKVDSPRTFVGVVASDEEEVSVRKQVENSLRQLEQAVRSRGED